MTACRILRRSQKDRGSWRCTRRSTRDDLPNTAGFIQPPTPHRRLTKLPIRDHGETQALAKSRLRTIPPSRPEHGTTRRKDPIWPDRQSSRNRYRSLRYTSTPISTKGDQGERPATKLRLHRRRANATSFTFRWNSNRTPIAGTMPQAAFGNPSHHVSLQRWSVRWLESLITQADAGRIEAESSFWEFGFSAGSYHQRFGDSPPQFRLFRRSPLSERSLHY